MARGFTSANQRFPFYDGMFDLVHGGGLLEDASETVKMELFLFLSKGVFDV